MTQFNGHHIKNFNQRCKSIVGDSKMILTAKETRDLQGEILELLVRLQELETENANLKAQATEITIELDGKSFK